MFRQLFLCHFTSNKLGKGNPIRVIRLTAEAEFTCEDLQQLKQMLPTGKLHREQKGWLVPA